MSCLGFDALNDAYKHIYSISYKNSAPNNEENFRAFVSSYKTAFSWGIIGKETFSQAYHTPSNIEPIGSYASNIEPIGSYAWGFRKIVALPLGLWDLLGAIMTLVIKVLFIDVPSSLHQRDLFPIEKGIAQAIRRLEFSIGRFVSLFDDETGCYLMGEANLALMYLIIG